MLPEKPAVRGLPPSIVGLAALGLAVALGVAILRPIFRQQPVTGQWGEAADPYADPIETADDAINALSNGPLAIVTATSEISYQGSSIGQIGTQGEYGIGDLTDIERDAMDYLANFIGNDIEFEQVVVRKTTTTQFDRMRSFDSSAAEELVWVIAFTTHDQLGADDVRLMEGDPFRDLSTSLAQARLPTLVGSQESNSSSAATPLPNRMDASGAATSYYVFRAATGDMIERGTIGLTHPYFTLDELAALPRE